MIWVRFGIRPLVLILIVGFGLWILLQLVQRALWVLVLVVLAIILAAALMPIVQVIRRARLPPGGWRVPKALAVIIVYATLAVLLVAITYFVGAVLLSELVAFISSLPQIAAQFAETLIEFERRTGVPVVTPAPEAIAGQLQELSTRALEALLFAVTVAEGIIWFFFQLFIVLALALFLIVESERIVAFWVDLFPRPQREKVHALTLNIGSKVGYWILGQIAVATITGVLAGIGAALLGLPYPALLGLVTAILDLAPVLGPTLMVFPGFLLGLSQSILVALAAVVFFYALAEFDGSVLSPLITGRAVEISPTLIIIAVPIGLALYGAIGALIAIPTTAALQIVTHEVILPWLHEQQEVAESGDEAPPEESSERAA